MSASVAPKDHHLPTQQRWFITLRLCSISTCLTSRRSGEWPMPVCSAQRHNSLPVGVCAGVWWCSPPGPAALGPAWSEIPQGHPTKTSVVSVPLVSGSTEPLPSCPLHPPLCDPLPPLPSQAQLPTPPTPGPNVVGYANGIDVRGEGCLAGMAQHNPYRRSPKPTSLSFNTGSPAARTALGTATIAGFAAPRAKLPRAHRRGLSPHAMVGSASRRWEMPRTRTL